MKTLDLDALAVRLREHDGACCGKGTAIAIELLNEVRRLRELLALEERHHREHATEAPAYVLPGERPRGSILKDLPPLKRRAR